MTSIVLLYSSGVMAQSNSELFLPEEVSGTVKLDISSMPDQSKEISYEALALFVKNEGEEYVSNAIQGQYTRDGDYLVFKPYFPFERGMTYVVRTENSNPTSTYSYQSFQIGKKKKLEEAKVVSIYPSASQLPENLLRFFIYFNTPMKKGQALKHIQLVDGDGNVDDHAFMEFKQELWSADGKRLTLLFDPGRIKRGVSTNRLRGPALQQGKQYKLSILDTWQDVYGQELSAKTSKDIEVVNAYRQHLKVIDWRLQKPRVNSLDSMTIHFDRIIDHALIQSMIKLEDGTNKAVAGFWEVLAEERIIRFLPEKKWKKGNYRIVIDSCLEDVAGNNFQNLLDHNKTDKENNSEDYQVVAFKL